MSSYVLLTVEQLYAINKLPLINDTEYIVRVQDNSNTKVNYKTSGCSAYDCKNHKVYECHCSLFDQVLPQKLYVIDLCKSHKYDFLSVKKDAVLRQLPNTHSIGAGLKYEMTNYHRKDFHRLFDLELDDNTYSYELLKDYCLEYGIGHNGSKEKLASNIVEFYNMFVVE